MRQLEEKLMKDITEVGIRLYCKEFGLTREQLAVSVSSLGDITIAPKDFHLRMTKAKARRYDSVDVAIHGEMVERPIESCVSLRG